MPQSSRSGRQIRGGPGGDAEGPIAIGGSGGDVDFQEAQLPNPSVPAPRTAGREEIAIGGSGGRVRLPLSSGAEGDIEGGKGGKATVTGPARNRRS